MFSHDTEFSLLVVVDFVNTDPSCGGTEKLASPEDVKAFVENHHVSSVNHDDFNRVEDLYAVRRRLRELFGVADAAVVAARVNALVAEAPVCPRLTDHDSYGWHLHYFAPDASLAEHLSVDGGIAIAQTVTAGQTDRLRVCEASDCEAVLVDLSRNRSKRYCDARGCGNRLNVAAYRERKRSTNADVPG